VSLKKGHLHCDAALMNRFDPSDRGCAFIRCAGNLTPVYMAPYHHITENISRKLCTYVVKMLRVK